MTTALLNGPTRIREDEVLAVVRQWFVRSRKDGWFYPRGDGVPLTRVQVTDTQYTVERRRKPNTAWTGLVTADLAEFSERSFETWVMGWALTAPR